MKKIKTILIVLFLFLSSASIALAEIPDKPLVGLEKLQQQGTGFATADDYSMATYIGVLIKTFLSILGLIFVILMLYAGYTWMMAQDEEKKVSASKDTIKRAIIGLIITVSSYAIWNLIAKIL